jgi:hypothetical protein
MYLTVTIDTEEDNWGEYDRPTYTVENLRRVPGLQQVFNDNGVRPTYLVSYPVVTSPLGREVLSSIAQQGLCEIGSHPHPWNTPPLEENRTPYNSFIHHLPVDLQYRKLKTLHEAIVANFGLAPTTYRSGRWAFSEDVARHLLRLGYTVDTSISAGFDWRQFQGPDYSAWSCDPYTYRTCVDGRLGSLLEVPATIDFVQRPRGRTRAMYRAIRSSVPAGNLFLGALDRLGVLNLASISPEIDTLPRMIRLATALQERGVPIINMFFHSPSLLEGCSPYVASSDQLKAFMDRVAGFLAFARSTGMRAVTMSELPATGVGGSTVKVLPNVAAQLGTP